MAISQDQHTPDQTSRRQQTVHQRRPDRRHHCACPRGAHPLQHHSLHPLLEPVACAALSPSTMSSPYPTQPDSQSGIFPCRAFRQDDSRHGAALRRRSSGQALRTHLRHPARPASCVASSRTSSTSSGPSSSASSSATPSASPRIFQPGVATYELWLKLGIVLVGARFLMQDLLHIGGLSLVLVAIELVLSLSVMTLLGPHLQAAAQAHQPALRSAAASAASPPSWPRREPSTPAKKTPPPPSPPSSPSAPSRSSPSPPSATRCT